MLEPQLYPVSETESQPFTHENYVLDARRKRVFDRRMQVMNYIIDGYGPTIISEVMGEKRTNIQYDIQWLRKNGYLNKDYNLRKKFRPTPETNYLIAERLRQNWTYRKIAEELGVSASTITNYVLKSEDKGIRAALAYKRGLNKRRTEDKPDVNQRNYELIVQHFGMTPEELSKANMEEFYAPEIKRAKKHGVLSISSTVRKTLYKYKLIKKPSNLKE